MLYDNSLMWGVGRSPISGRLGGLWSGGEMLDSGSRYTGSSSQRPVPSVSWWVFWRCQEASLREGILSWSAPLSNSFPAVMSATRGGLFSSCHLLLHMGERSALTRSAPSASHLLLVSLFLFIPVYTFSLCWYVILCFVLPCICRDILSSIFLRCPDPQARINLSTG